SVHVAVKYMNGICRQITRLHKPVVKKVDHNSKIVLHCSNSYQLTQKNILFIQYEQLVTGKRMLLFYLLRLADFSRSFLFNIFFLNRIVSGVTSQYSSSSKKDRKSTRLNSSH